MPNSTFGSRLREARKMKGFTQKQLADAIGAKHNSISNWENDQNRPGPDSIELILGVLGISANSLLENKRLPWVKPELNISGGAYRIARAYEKAPSPIQRTVEVALEPFMEDNFQPNVSIQEEGSDSEPSPMVDKIVYTFPAAAGIPLYADDDYERMDFPADQVPNGADFGIRIQGDSMEPTIADGTIVWVRKTPEMRNGQIGIFMIDDSAVCKRYYMDKGKVRLESDNDAYEPIIMHDFEQFGIVGRVLEYR